MKRIPALLALGLVSFATPALADQGDYIKTQVAQAVKTLSVPVIDVNRLCHDFAGPSRPHVETMCVENAQFDYNSIQLYWSDLTDARKANVFRHVQKSVDTTTVGPVFGGYIFVYNDMSMWTKNQYDLQEAEGKVPPPRFQP
ncbi:hypothetical protein SAMN05444161_3883 [Rhizobiales bacterium GAS191]|nr:hypothetical protein SAMN05444161_3883 [Rhizobiales bacterium GAS191]